MFQSFQRRLALLAFLLSVARCCRFRALSRRKITAEVPRRLPPYVPPGQWRPQVAGVIGVQDRTRASRDRTRACKAGYRVAFREAASRAASADRRQARWLGGGWDSAAAASAGLAADSAGSVVADSAARRQWNQASGIGGIGRWWRRGWRARRAGWRTRRLGGGLGGLGSGLGGWARRWARRNIGGGSVASAVSVVASRSS